MTRLFRTPVRLVERLLRDTLPTNLVTTWVEVRRHLRLSHAEDRLEMVARRISLDRYSSNGSQPIDRYAYSVTSQNGEDGILLHIFDLIGTTDQVFIEFGIADGRECNSRHLAADFGWRGLAMDCSLDNIAVARRYFPEAVQLRPAFITAESIDQILTEAGFGGEIDLLSIDVDGNDFWIWSAISCVTPRVVVVEYNACLGSDPVTIPYHPDFRATSTYFGASLSALALLAETKGYVLVGVDPNGVNAFFVREDCRGPFQAVDAKGAWRPNRLLHCPEPPSGDLVDVERLLENERTGR